MLTALQSLHLFGLRAFGACGNEEAYTLPFVKGLVTASFDLSEVNKNICAAFRGDETETFNFVKPLNSTSLASCHDVYLQKFESAQVQSLARAECREKTNRGDEDRTD